jgi:hypothetical protein
MAVGLWIQFPGGTREQYEAANTQMNVEAEPPDGLIFHSAGPMEGGWSIVDFWESREKFDAFQQGRLTEAIGALGDRGFPGPPTVKEFPVENIIAP